jgi:hypothetical protein
MIQETASFQALGFQSFDNGPSVAHSIVRSGAGNS